MATTAQAAAVTLRWDYTASGAAGFVLYCGPASRSYSTRIDVGNTETYTITSLPEGATSFCAVTAYDTAKVESARSNELSFYVAGVAPVVNFSATPTSGTVPLSVVFTNTTAGQVTSWSWNFGDGTTSTAKNPTHVYSKPGSYRPVLTVSGPGGTVSRTAATAITVAAPAPPVANFTISPGSGAAPLSVAFTNTTTGQVTSWSWNFGDGTTSIVKNPTHVYTAPGSYRPTLTAIGPGGTVTRTATTVITVTTAPVADTTAPSAPSGLTATASASGQIDLAWTASRDNVGVARYRVERCQGAGCSNFTALPATPTATSLRDTAVAAATTYRYRVRATDAAGNVSAYSGIVSATTPAAADVTPPTVPTNVTARAASASRIYLTWVASTDNVAVRRYVVYRCQGASCSNFVAVASTTLPLLTDDGLASNTVYRYRVRALDQASNVSGYSPVVNGRTLAQ